MDSVNYLPTKTILSSKKNQYIIRKVLGQGGFGIVYSAIDRQNQKVAIKEYFPSSLATRLRNSHTVSAKDMNQDNIAYFQKGVQRFYEEAIAMKRFQDDPNIVDVKDFFKANGTAYIVMEFVDGKTFLEVLNAMPDNRLELNDVIMNIKPIFKALERIHTTPWTDANGKVHSGIVHRDISPDNIMFPKSGSVKLMDFGAARTVSLQGEFELTGIVKPGFAPVEQFVRSGSKGAQGPWTDVYALAATIYRAITGVKPQDSRRRQMNDALKLPSALGINITTKQEQVLLKGMALDYHYRYQTVKEFYQALKNAMIIPPPPPPPPPPNSLTKVYWAIAAVVILIVLYLFVKLGSASIQQKEMNKELSKVQSQLTKYDAIEKNYGRGSDNYYALNPVLVLQASGDEGKLSFYWNGSAKDLNISTDLDNLDCSLEDNSNGQFDVAVKPKAKRGCYIMTFANKQNSDNFKCWVIII